MKKLIVISLICLFFSCNKEEPKTLIVTNYLDRAHFTWNGDPTYTECTTIYYYDATKERVRTDKIYNLFTKIRYESASVVTSTTLEDNIVSMHVVVSYMYPGVYIDREFTSDLIQIHEGLNEYNIRLENSHW